MTAQMDKSIRGTEAAIVSTGPRLHLFFSAIDSLNMLNVVRFRVSDTAPVPRMNTIVTVKVGEVERTPTTMQNAVRCEGDIISIRLDNNLYFDLRHRNIKLTECLLAL